LIEFLDLPVAAKEDIPVVYGVAIEEFKWGFHNSFIIPV